MFGFNQAYKIDDVFEFEEDNECVIEEKKTKCDCGGSDLSTCYALGKCVNCGAVYNIFDYNLYNKESSPFEAISPEEKGKKTLLFLMRKDRYFADKENEILPGYNNCGKFSMEILHEASEHYSRILSTYNSGQISLNNKKKNPEGQAIVRIRNRYRIIAACLDYTLRRHGYYLLPRTLSEFITGGENIPNLRINCGTKILQGISAIRGEYKEENNDQPKCIFKYYFENVLKILNLSPLNLDKSDKFYEVYGFREDMIERYSYFASELFVTMKKLNICMTNSMHSIIAAILYIILFNSIVNMEDEYISLACESIKQNTWKNIAAIIYHPDNIIRLFGVFQKYNVRCGIEDFIKDC